MRNSRISPSFFAFLFAFLFALCPFRGEARDLTITLVGTGGPELTPHRSGIATAIEANGEVFLFDAGRNTLDNLYLARISPQAVQKIFLTHLHNDHIEGLPTLWITPWFLLGRTASLRVWGPAGTREMVQGMRQMYAHDLALRSNPVLKQEYLDIDVNQLTGGAIYSDNGVKIQAFEVDHHEGNPAFGYRFESGGRSVFLTGDTTVTPSLAQAASGVDVLVANVAAGTASLEASNSIQPILSKLLSPEQGAALFLAARPRIAVFSHIVKKGLPGAAGDRSILARTRRAGYAGQLFMGQDGMKIEVGAQVKVRCAAARRTLPDFDSPASRF